jgi:hypothetical protein
MDLGIRTLSGGNRRDGADGVLMHQARLLKRKGIETFIVASNDHRFARIAAIADLHVLTLTDAYLSGRLRATARTITVLRLDGEGWRTESVPAGPAPSESRRDQPQVSPAAAMRRSMSTHQAGWGGG